MLKKKNMMNYYLKAIRNVLEIIISQKVKCYYCKCNMYILYDNLKNVNGH